MQLRRNKELEFERLKKSHKKQIIIGALAICVIGGTLTFATSRAKYKLTEDIELAKGTINYKPYDFKVMAMYKSEDGINYIEINDMPSSGYVINEEKTYCTTDNKTEIKGKIKTVNGVHGLYNINKNDKCYLYFDKYVPQITNITELITSLNAKIDTPDFSNVATTDEGVYVTGDGMYFGITYYWRGAVTNNHVIFANKCWRIVRINGDNTIRLIYNGEVLDKNTCAGNVEYEENIAVTNQAYAGNRSTGSAPAYVGWSYSGSQRTLDTTNKSNAMIQTESWYNINIGSNSVYGSKVADGKFCNDRNVVSGTWSSQISSQPFHYAAYYRAIGNPTLLCSSGDIYVLKAGAITMDEVKFAGGIYNQNNTSYYLYNGQWYWTMSPSHWYYYSTTSRGAAVYSVDANGNLFMKAAHEEGGIRPVINLKADITFAAGSDGTQSNPYVVQ